MWCSCVVFYLYFKSKLALLAKSVILCVSYTIPYVVSMFTSRIKINPEIYLFDLCLTYFMLKHKKSMLQCSFGCLFWKCSMYLPTKQILINYTNKANYTLYASKLMFLIKYFIVLNFNLLDKLFVRKIIKSL